MRQQLGSMKQSMTSNQSESTKSDKLKWKEILVGSLIALVIGIILIHYEIFVTNDKSSPAEVATPSVNQTPVPRETEECETAQSAGDKEQIKAACQD